MTTVTGFRGLAMVAALYAAGCGSDAKGGAGVGGAGSGGAGSDAAGSGGAGASGAGSSGTGASGAGSGGAGSGGAGSGGAGSGGAGASGAGSGGAGSGGMGTGSNEPGKQVRMLMVDGAMREVIVYVPERARGQTVPAVFVFHGTSQDGEHFYTESRWKEKADAEGFLALFPTAQYYCYKEDENGDGDFDDPGERSITTKWTDGGLGNRLPLCTPAELATFPADRRARADHPLQDDLAFVRAMNDLLAREYRVDPKRRYVTGFSNGGAFTSRVAVELATEFAAAGPGSGGLSVVPTPIAARAIPVLHWVGSNDDRFFGTTPPPVAESTVMLPQFKSYFIDRFRTALQLEDVYTYEQRMVGNHTVGTWLYTRSTVAAPGATFRFALLGDMFHVYPNGSNYPLAAADLLWDFFKERSLP